MSETEKQNEQFARRWVEEVWNTHRFDIVHECLDAKGVGHLEGPAEVHGPEEVILQLRMITDAFSGFRVAIDEMLCSGDNVIFRWSATGIHDGPLLDIAPTGEKIAISGMTWMKIRQGKLVEGWDRWNQGALLAQLRAARN